MAQHRTRTLMYPLNRRFMLSDRITEERRREIITDRANFLVEYESHLIPEDREGWISQGWDGDGRQYPWTPERLHAVLEGYGKMWRESPDHAEFVSVFRKLAREKRLPNINRIVCFGHGPPGGLGIRGTNEGDDDETRYGNDLIGNGRSCLQYAAALDFAQLISGLTHGRPIDVWVQDPFLTRTDIQALELYGVRVANPYMQEGYTLVDRNTFVIGIFVNREAHLEAMCLEGGRPALIIWTDVKNAETRKVPERAAALDILAREYDTVKPIKALGEPDEDEDEDEDEDGEELSSSSSATGSSSSPPPSAASSAFSLPESWVLVYREDPPLARSTMYVPKAAKRPAVRDDDSNTTSSSEGEPLFKVRRLVNMREVPARREYFVEYESTDADSSGKGKPMKGAWMRDVTFRDQPWLIRDFHDRFSHIAPPPPDLEAWQRAVERKRAADDDDDDETQPRKKRSRTPSSTGYIVSDHSSPRKRRNAPTSKKSSRRK